MISVIVAIKKKINIIENLTYKNAIQNYSRTIKNTCAKNSSI